MDYGFQNYINSIMVKTGPNCISVNKELLYNSLEYITSRSLEENLKFNLKYYWENSCAIPTSTNSMQI